MFWIFEGMCFVADVSFRSLMALELFSNFAGP